MYRLLIIMFLALTFTFCSKEDKAPEMSYQDLTSLTEAIQTDINELNLQIEDIDAGKVHDLQHFLADLADDIDRLNYELEIGAEETQTYKKAHDLYAEIVNAYDKAGFDVKKVNEKLQKLADAVK
jgi:peptidoglycan hydrolase CwlO-like protein